MSINRRVTQTTSQWSDSATTSSTWRCTNPQTCGTLKKQHSSLVEMEARADPSVDRATIVAGLDTGHCWKQGGGSAGQGPRSNSGGRSRSPSPGRQDFRDRKCYGCGEKGRIKKNCPKSSRVSRTLVAVEDDVEDEAAVAKFRATFRIRDDSKAQTLLAANPCSSCTLGFGRLFARLQAAHIEKQDTKKATWTDDSDDEGCSGAAYMSLDLDDMGVNEDLCSVYSCVTSGAGGELAAWQWLNRMRDGSAMLEQEGR